MTEYRTKQQLVYDALRERIVSGQLEPGVRLTIRSLAELMNVSESPIREAVRQLEAEGFMTTVPHTGVSVSRLSADEVCEIVEIRKALEPLAAYLAAKHITDAELQALVEVLAEMADAAEVDDGDRYIQLNRQFHEIIYKAGQNQRLYDLIFNLWDNIDRYSTVFRYVRGHMTRSLREHETIVDVLRSRDPEAARHAMIVHRHNASLGLRRLEQRLRSEETSVHTVIDTS
jgi:DNA-binding GntR family transcriptional regulator